MEYKRLENSIEITLSAAKFGKFYFKTREKSLEFGKSFSARKSLFDETVYLEWLIGYYVPVKGYESGTKHTKITQETFTIDNKKYYLYELSEILYEAIKGDLVITEEVDNLLNEIISYKNFIGENEIAIEENTEKKLLNGLEFIETSIKLPTFFMPQSDGTLIEISIQKQQKATSVQPMVYFCIPFKSFVNWKDLEGKSSVKGDKLKYIISRENINVLLNMFRIFGMASRRHKFDVEEILKTIKKLI